MGRVNPSRHDGKYAEMTAFELLEVLSDVSIAAHRVEACHVVDATHHDAHRVTITTDLDAWRELRRALDVCRVRVRLGSRQRDMYTSG